MRQTYALVVWLAFIFAAMPSQAQYQARSSLFSSYHYKLARYQGVKWRNIGPFRGGRSVAVAGVAGDPMVYYMGSTGGGLWKTEDAGINWENISDNFFRSGSVGAIAVAPSDPNIIYAGMGEHAVRSTMSSCGDGIYKSMDGGKTWVHAGLIASRHIAAIEIHPQDPDIVFVAVQGPSYGPSDERGVYKTSDGGLSWRKTLFINNYAGACDLSIDPENPRILYAGMWDHHRRPWAIRSGGSGSGIFKSADGGENWERLKAGLPAMMGKVAVDVSPADPDIVYANIEAENGGVFRSRDGGLTWEQTSTDRATVARAWYYIEIFADPADPETVYVLNESLLRSADGGRTFQDIPSPHSDQHHMWINPDNTSNVILANDGGACITFNGGRSWSSQYNQPTGQFYRVIADNRFPYFVYGGQQDYSTVAIASRTTGAGIGPRDWGPVSGCESAFIAFDPDDPREIYGGCYQGYIEIYDQVTEQSKDITAYPVLGIGEAPKNMKYRFNWNAPIVARPQDPQVVYHAANKVLRTDDGGMTWQEISPDLTRNDPEKQGPGGGPFTNEGAGGENYNTISYLACSPHQAGVIWAGSDDGLVHITMDDGLTWSDVTPEGLGEALINCIEVSPHQPGTAYIVASRHKFNDPAPRIYYTADFGKTWQLMVNGIAGSHFVKVVREDPAQPGLLYAGTESGFYISFNNGAYWHALQLNLPVCPVTDLFIHDNDLIAATAGRGFWILDDIGVFQQSMGNLPDNQVTLFRPKPTVRFLGAAPDRPVPGLGQNPLPGVIFDYYLPFNMDSSQLTLQVLDPLGRLIRTYSNQENKDFTPWEGGPEPEILLPSQSGVNRFHWDMRREPIPGIPKVFVHGGYQGSFVGPGTYTLRLISRSDTLEQQCVILPDPRLEVSPADYAKQQELLQKMDNAVREIHLSVNRMREVRKQMTFVIDQLKKAGGADKLVQHGIKVQKKMVSWEEALIQPKQQTAQDVINYPNKLNSEILSLINRVDTPDPRITNGAYQRMNDLLKEWAGHKAVMQEIMEKDVPRFNRMFREQDIPVVVIPSSAD